MRRLHHFRLLLIVCLLLPLAGTGCDNLKKIPLFNPAASHVNQANSALELYAQVNFEVAKARDAGLVTQAAIDKQITPSLVKAKAIIMSVRTVAHATTRPTTGPTTQPIGTLEEARNLLLGVRTVLEQLKQG